MTELLVYDVGPPPAHHPYLRIVVVGTCYSCGDPAPDCYCTLCDEPSARLQCAECHAETRHAILPRVSYASYARRAGAPFYGKRSDGSVGDPSPWQENAIRHLEDQR